MNFTKTTLQKLELIFTEQDYTIRYEKGNFQSGYCMVEERKVVIINKFFDVEGRINTLLEIEPLITIMEDNLDEKSLEFYQKIHSLKPTTS